MTLTANFPFSLVESQSTKLKERFESVGKGHEFAAGLPGGSTQADSAEIMGLRPMGGPLSYKQQTQVRFLQLRLAGRQLCFGNIAQLVAATAR